MAFNFEKIAKEKLVDKILEFDSSNWILKFDRKIQLLALPTSDLKLSLERLEEAKRERYPQMLELKLKMGVFLKPEEENSICLSKREKQGRRNPRNATSRRSETKN